MKKFRQSDVPREDKMSKLAIVGLVVGGLSVLGLIVFGVRKAIGQVVERLYSR